MNNRTILVTGSDGFIGSHLAEQLTRDGHKVKALVQYNSFNSWGWLDDSHLKSEMEIISGDIRDSFFVKNAVKNCNCIFHLAALIAIPFSYYSPYSYLDTNVIGTLNLLNASRDNQIEKFIHTSTSEVYGTAQYVPIDEKHPLNAQSPYAASKIGADQLALSFFKSFDIPVTIIRPFNTYGPRQSARAVIPTIISQILSNKKIINLGNTSTTRDFNYISDTVRGFIHTLSRKDISGEVINIGSNYEVSIRDTVNLIAKILKKEINIHTSNNRKRPEKSEVERLWCDNTLAKKLLNWQPQFSGIEGFEKGLRETVNWFSIDENIKRYKSNIYNL